MCIRKAWVSPRSIYLYTVDADLAQFAEFRMFGKSACGPLCKVENYKCEHLRIQEVDPLNVACK